MALSTTFYGQQLYIPGSYVNETVQANNSGLATAGVIALVGEAAQGLSYNQETDLTVNWFSPDQSSDVIAKYGSGPLVDAFRARSPSIY